MTSQHQLSIAIVGAGAVGSALAGAFSDYGHSVRVGTSNPEATRNRLELLIGSDATQIMVCTAEQAVEHADICLLTVSDHVIEEVCTRLAQHFSADCVVAHCSGALDSTHLKAASNRHLPVCSAHPLNTFPDAAAARKLLADQEHGTALFCEGDNAALRKITTLFEETGFQSIEIPRRAKPLYHAACVFACNYLTVLMDLGLQTAEGAGLERQQFWQALQPIIQTTIKNITAQGTAASLSGPVARGDVDTVSKHLDALAGFPGPESETLSRAYKILARHAVALAEKDADLEPSTVEELTIILR